MRAQIVQDVWARQLQLSLHGWIYGLSDEHLRVGVSRPGDLEPTYHRAIAGLGARALPNA